MAAKSRSSKDGSGNGRRRRRGAAGEASPAELARIAHPASGHDPAIRKLALVLSRLNRYRTR